FSGRGRPARAGPHGQGRPGPDEEAEALAEEVMRLLRDAEARRRLGCFGRELVEARYSEDAMVEAVLDIYREAREGCRP
ncbi:MAG: glycosyltransferase family 1 protein, partial [Dehalococcoidia bacterium]|nr:glycosyltransferase family 1 protein [Dehalococcoidia bacterium]